MFTLAFGSTWSGIRRSLFVTLLASAGLSIDEAKAAQASWFPDTPSIRSYTWSYQTCSGCREIVPNPAWERMATLAGLQRVRFMLAPDELAGEAYSAAPDVVVLSPATLRLESCQLAFVVGHEIVHIAQRHFDEDAVALSVYSGKPANWTDSGADAMQLVDGNFGLAMRVSHLWQDQETEADWVGALLAAQASGCNIESGAMAYLRRDIDSGGGLAASHAPGMERMRQLLPFAEAAQRLADRMSHPSSTNLAGLRTIP